MKFIDDKLFIALIGVVITFYFGFLKYKIENDKIFKELFIDFNGRYDNAFNDLLNEIKNNPKRVLTQPEINLIIDYFNLCAEEYLWYSKKRIPKEVWVSWKAGIHENLNIVQVNEIFKKETHTLNGKKSFYGIVEELNVYK